MNICECCGEKAEILLEDYREVDEKLLKDFSLSVIDHMRKKFTEFQVCMSCWKLEDKRFWNQLRCLTAN